MAELPSPEFINSLVSSANVNRKYVTRRRDAHPGIESNHDVIADQDLLGNPERQKRATVFHFMTETGAIRRSVELDSAALTTGAAGQALQQAMKQTNNVMGHVADNARVGMVVDALKSLEGRSMPQPFGSQVNVPATTPGWYPNQHQNNQFGQPQIEMGTPNDRVPEYPRQLQPKGFQGATMLPSSAYPQEPLAKQAGVVAPVPRFQVTTCESPQSSYMHMPQPPQRRVWIEVPGFGRLEFLYHNVRFQRRPVSHGQTGEPFAVYLTYDNDYRGGSRYMADAIDTAVLYVEDDPLCYNVAGTGLIHDFIDPERNLNFSTAILMIDSTVPLG